jgi:hypothetical protein
MIKQSYWDIDDFLSEEEPVTIEITQDLKGLGLLDQSSEKLDLESGSRSTQPLWIALTMVSREMANVAVPKYFEESYRNTLEADPRIISLRERSHYFFEVGSKLNTVLQGSNLTPLLLKVFIARVLHLHNEASNNSDPKIMKKLTELELEIYEKAMKSLREYSEWRDRKFDMIRAYQNNEKNTKRFRVG